MAVLYGAYTAPVGTTPRGNVTGAQQGARVRVYRETITLATQTTSDTIVIADNVPVGSTFLYGVLLASATLGGTATIAIGVSGSTGKYRAAAIFTAADTPTLFGIAANAAPLTAAETVFITIAAASLPGSGTLHTALFYCEA
jgi:hypothetical protein